MRKKIKVDFFVLDRAEYEEKTNTVIRMLLQYGKVVNHLLVQNEKERYILIDLISACSKDEIIQALSRVADDYEILD